MRVNPKCCTYGAQDDAWHRMMLLGMWRGMGAAAAQFDQSDCFERPQVWCGVGGQAVLGGQVLSTPTHSSVGHSVPAADNRWCYLLSAFDKAASASETRAFTMLPVCMNTHLWDSGARDGLCQ